MIDPFTGNLCTYLRSVVILILLFISTTVLAQGPCKDSVLRYAHEIGIKYPKICQAQAQLETGHYTSYGCKYRNNLFGFRGTHHYKKFECWKESIDYYKEYQDSHAAHTTTKHHWFMYVSLHFSQDRRYGHKLLNILSQHSYKATVRVNFTSAHYRYHEEKTRTNLCM